ncbi:MAG: sulfurtransferase TusA [Pseudomonadales bacterium]|nr:sulfurtransferase TusA [Pseudomonadales bacterium]
MSKEPNELNEADGSAPAKLELDARGLYCPEPVMLLHNKIRDIAAGETLKLTATDPSTTRDVPKFCMYLGHELVSHSQQGELYFYLIKKKQE